MPRHNAQNVIDLTAARAARGGSTSAPTMLEEGAEVTDLYPCGTYEGPCPTDPDVMMLFILQHGRLAVEVSRDSVHQARTDYVERSRSHRRASSYASRVMRVTLFDRYRSLQDMVETLQKYELLPAWLRVV